jgi:tetratricopeptide (TPR) repeat protein
VTSPSDHDYQQALATLEIENLPLSEKLDTLIEIATGLQQKPKSARQLNQAVELYDQALALCLESDQLMKARIRASRATALQMMPGEDARFLIEAHEELSEALPVIEASGTPEEAADIHINLGLVLQSLAGCGKAKITDSITHYQKALLVFKKDDHPREYAILHNNLATAYLSIPMADARANMREALAVQSFQAALEVVTLEDDPNEYAMLQNNLGNALQYASSSHAFENNMRAIEAYDEALKVRNPRTCPQSYANTIANKANCLRNLAGDPNRPGSVDIKRLKEARDLYKSACEIFDQFGESSKVQVLSSVLGELEIEIVQCS